MFAPEVLGGFHIPEELSNLIAQNWSLVGVPQLPSALQLGKIRIRMTHQASNS